MTATIHPRRPLRPALAALSLAVLSQGCGGLAFFADQCFGPYCDIGCTSDADCPEPSHCTLSRCSVDANADGGGNSDGAGTDGGTRPDGALEEQPYSDPGPGDGLSGDPQGDQDWGDNVVVGADGLTCQDFDRDGYCPCCPAGPECGNVAGSEYDATIHPGATEVCDGKDNNCDGQTDEGVLNACGNCLPYPLCNTDDPWVDPGPGAVLCGVGLPACVLPATCVDGACSVDRGVLPPPNPNDGTVLDDKDVPPDGRGGITLQAGTIATDFAWPASETNGTISRIDTVLNKEVGRYPVVLSLPNDPHKPYVAPYDHTPNTGPRTACAEPSRSTVDEFGNAYIANRAVSGYTGRCDNEDSAPNQMGSVSKIGFYHETLCNHALNPTLAGCQCVDRNGDHYIQTSKDYDNDGIEPSTCPGDCSTITFGACTGSKCATACAKDADCGGGYFCVFIPGATGTNKQRCTDTPNLPEFLGVNDECLLWTRRIPGLDHDTNLITNANRDSGSWRSAPRAMAIDRPGYIWVGAYDAQKVYKLRADGEFVYPRDPDGAGPLKVNDVCTRTLRYLADGGPVANPSDCVSQTCYETIPDLCRLALAGQQPYGAVVDSGKKHPDHAGYLWLSRIWSTPVLRIDTANGDVAAAPTLGNNYGITIDHQDRVWTADYASHSIPQIYRLTPDVCVGAGCATPCTTTAECAGTPGASCYYGKCSTALGVQDTFSPSLCVGPWCRYCDEDARAGTQCGDNSCDGDQECASAPLGYRRCTADAITQNRGCTKECTTNADCSPYWGTTCVGGMCSWDSHDYWLGRGATTDLVADPAACAAQGAPQSPCSRVWTVYSYGGIDAPNWLFAFDGDTGHEISELRRRVDMDDDRSSNTSLNGADNSCSGPVGVGVGIGGKIWVVAQTDSAVCAYDPSPSEFAADMVVVPIDLHPYTYSDFTGNIYRSFTNPQGKYRVLVDACPTDYKIGDWGVVTWEADTPGQSKIEVRFRIGNTLAEAQNPGTLQDGPVTQPPNTSYDLPYVDGEWLEIEFNLIADSTGVMPAPRPTLYRVSVARSCIYAPGG